ncbi:MAG: MFS transporter, partial [Azovibrio sp.]
MTAGASSFSSRAVALVCCGVAASLTIYASQALLGMLVEEFGVTGGNATLSISATTLGIALFSPFAGLISDRFGRKRVIVAASLLMLIPTLGAAFCSSFEAFILWRFMQGVLVPCIF